jgi:hypothetical protein
MAGDPLERLNQLITLATDPATTEQEARSVALVACRAIKRLGVVLSIPGGRPVNIPGFDPSNVPPGAFVIDLAELMQTLLSTLERPAAATEPRARKRKKKEEPPKCMQCGVRPPTRDDGRCGNCGFFHDRRKT